jgi:hypothetical protein
MPSVGGTGDSAPWNPKTKLSPGNGNLCIVIVGIDAY